MIRIIKKIIKATLARFGFQIIRIVNFEPEEKAYYCRALTGMSGYNISINSDMSVSCSCNDPSGEGKIGILDSSNTLKSVFFGEKANKMRAELASGKMPISICSNCMELCEAPKNIAEYYSKHFEMPVNGIMIENCIECNYNCKCCDRKEITKNRTSTIISVDNMKYIANELKENKIRYISFYKLGEPFLDKEIYTKIKIIKQINPEITIGTSTNGLLIDNPEKVEAALLLDIIYFSIDGINTNMQNKYQRGADFNKIMDNVKRIIKKRGSLNYPLIIWKYVVFSWNEDKEIISEVFRKAVEIGFDRILFTEGLVGSSNINEKSKRYYMKDFIPENINYKLIQYIPGYGMEFDLHS